MVRCIVRWLGVSIWIVEAIAELDIRPPSRSGSNLIVFAYILDHCRAVYYQHIALLCFPNICRVGVYYYRARVGYIQCDRSLS